MLPEGSTGMTKFLVAIPTHNRAEMVNDAVRSVFEQTCSDWQLLVSDNASIQPARPAIRPEYQCDSRFHVIRHDALMSATDHGELIFRYSLDYDYDYLIILADDDLLLPSALAYVAQHGQKYAVVTSSFWYYNQVERQLALDNGGGNDLAALIPFQSRDFFGYFMESTGIHLADAALQHRVRPPIGLTHVSTHFFKKSILRAALERYGRIGVAPFGDVGFFRLNQSGTCLYINRPLAIIRVHPISDIASSVSGAASRFQLSARHAISFEYSPVKAITFQNCTLESCLALASELGLEYDRRIDAIFFIRHLQEIVRDRPWTATTLRDALEAVWFLLGQAPQAVARVAAFISKRSHPPANSSTLIQNIDGIWDAVPVCEEYADKPCRL
jgi:hypothetical protein